MQQLQKPKQNKFITASPIRRQAFRSRPLFRDYPRGDWNAKAEAKVGSSTTARFRELAEGLENSNWRGNLIGHSDTFFFFLERKDVGWDLQPYGMEQQRARNQHAPLPQLLTCGHRIVRKIHQMTAAQRPEHTIVRRHLWRRDADQVLFRSTSSHLQ